ncbi:gliding motility-associated C-terminal domain-containing protein [Tamlana sp. 2201CG12-4]|uniref:gliding motility-associated C-terminal domain-containing protein n=1 Tax=Tamlana sp. 2201CG12-4 TaxID=3112582 RepID=UPI002DBC1E8E|nr:gliding motility-associated C-terminal domain-containing protein [Tamlana sp. 2201CG12-4]MEC3906859.1 gliding motility-associated C-terminal domain-containing protein [Tamlana sp. 2201CG12-4]
MKTNQFIVYLVLVFFSFFNVQAQCNIVDTITVCDMTTIDKDGDGIFDGIINLYDEYNALPGTIAPISLSSGTWYDPNFNFALDEATGDLYLWDLDNASRSVNDYEFQFIDTSSSCPNGVVLTVNLILGPFEGKPLPPVGVNDANITVCEAVLSSFDLFQVFESQPSPHENGIWTFIGNLGDPSNFISLSQDGTFEAKIPYVPGGDLIEFDVFEFTYTVPGILPCSPQKVSNFKVEVIRDVFSGSPSTFEICETDVLDGLWDGDIDLRDDRFLAGEDIEGTWSASGDVTNQISGPLDSTINLREVFDYLKLNTPKYGCREFKYKYKVEARSTLTDCSDRESEVIFRFYEPIKPFQQSQPLDICLDGTQPAGINLYNQITFTTENGELYDYPENISCTDWSFVSGPNDNDIRVAVDSGIIDLTNLTRADAGSYVFRYTVSSSCNNCLSGGTSACRGQSANIIVNINTNLYAGEDTLGLQFCETDPVVAAPLDLFSLLTTNGVDGPVYNGPMGAWTDSNTGMIIANPIAYSIPTINDQQYFDFTYTTITSSGCLDRANLTFTVFEAYQSGTSNTIDVCDNSSPFSLISQLTGTPNTNGIWSGPNGFSSLEANVVFDPMTSEAGVYTYTVPDNINASGTTMCSGNQATLTVTLHQSPNAGVGGSYAVCQSDLQINLIDYLDQSADLGGTFSDLNATGALTNNSLAVSQLSQGTYNFQYEIQGHTSCALSTSVLSITIEEVDVPTTTNQTFCAIDGAIINDLVAMGGVDFNWYDTATSTIPLSHGTKLIDGEDYYVSALNHNNCESPRVSMAVTILPADHVDCNSCFKDGVSANGDNENDEFDLCGLPITFPNFEISIFNRYGVVVYKGNKNTPLFKGDSNVSLTLGKKLPSGIYFYVFDPRDGVTKSLQGNFYLSR